MNPVFMNQNIAVSGSIATPEPFDPEESLTGYPDIDNFLEECLETMRVKGHDYRQGNDADVLHNFRTVAESVGIPMQKVWFTYFYKHYSALATFIKEEGQQESEPIEGRVKDMIVYLLLFYRMLNDRPAHGETLILQVPGTRTLDGEPYPNAYSVQSSSFSAPFGYSGPTPVPPAGEHVEIPGSSPEPAPKQVEVPIQEVEAVLHIDDVGLVGHYRPGGTIKVDVNRAKFLAGLEVAEPKPVLEPTKVMDHPMAKLVDPERVQMLAGLKPTPKQELGDLGDPDLGPLDPELLERARQVTEALEERDRLEPRGGGVLTPSPAVQLPVDMAKLEQISMERNRLDRIEEETVRRVPRRFTNDE